MIDFVSTPCHPASSTMNSGHSIRSSNYYFG